MLNFNIKGRARLRAVADFATGAVLNLDFLDATGAHIPFHLSLRRDEGLVVLNRRDAAGWRREIRVPMAFARAPVSVDLVLTARWVAVQVGGRRIGRFDAWPRPDRQGRFGLRRGFPDLARIAGLNWQGALQPGSLLTGSGEAPPKGLHLTEGLELALRGLGAGCPLRGRVEAGALTLPAQARRLANLLPDGQQETALVCTLPGRVWLGVGEGLALRLCGEDGIELGQLTLSRAGMAERIAAGAGMLALDDRTALQAIEHARHGALLPLLPPAAQAALFQAAERFGLGVWLAEGSDVPPPAPPPLPAPEAAVTQAATAFHLAMRAAPPAEAPARLDEALRRLPALADRLALLSQLTEWFCLSGDPRDLFVARQRNLSQGALPVSPRDPWSLSVALPHLYIEGAFAAVAETLRALVPPGPEWVVTPALGWVAREIARNAPDHQGRRPADWQRWAMVAAFLDVLAARKGDYWARTPCARLRGGLVALLGQRETLPPELRERLIWLAMQLYGMSPAFWSDLAAQPDSALPPRLAELRAAFARLREGVEAYADSANLAFALAPFRQIGSVDLPRFARDLLGAGGDGEALRAAAFPGAVPVGADPATLRAELAAGWRGVGEAPFRGALTALRQQADPLPLLAALGGATARFQGLTTAMDLARGRLTAGDAAGGAALLQAAGQIIATLDDSHAQEALGRACGPSVALTALLAEHGARPEVRALAVRLRDSVHPVPMPQTRDLTADLRAAADPVQDTLLCLYSCRAHLETRVATIRQTWAPLLARMGVPFLVFVGGGDGTRGGDVVALDCPDDYEGLPQKTLAMMRWVYDNTRFSHLVKVDDDCLLDPQEWFGDLAHRGVDYYGRPLHRVRGQMDRAWHMAKSSSPRGRLELDKSPEPSTYADGGSGYALSRRAMAALLDAAASPEGQELIALSFMEDKLVGDLLARRGIWVENTDYRVSVLRRTRPGGPLVAQWENGFLPFRGSGIKLVHLDGHERMAEVTAALDDPLPRPAKLWPTFQPLRLGSRSNTLDLLSPADKLRQVNAAPVAVIACLRNEVAILPRFLAHYRALGVQGFLIADNGSDDGSLEMLLQQPDVATFAVDTDYSASHYGVAWQQALLGNLRCGRWSLVADADEFLLWDSGRDGSLAELVQSPDFAGADAARVFMLDMYPEGPLAEADFTKGDPFDLAPCVDRAPFLAVAGMRGPYSDAPVWTSALRHRLIPDARPELFVAQKIALLKYRPWMRLSAGLHFAADVQLARRDLLFAHFKYNAAFHAKTQAEVARRQHFNNAEEYRKYQALLAEGRDVLWDAERSVRWQECDVVQKIVAGGQLQG